MHAHCMYPVVFWVVRSLNSFKGKLLSQCPLRSISVVIKNQHERKKQCRIMQLCNVYKSNHAHTSYRLLSVLNVQYTACWLMQITAQTKCYRESNVHPRTFMLQTGAQNKQQSPSQDENNMTSYICKSFSMKVMYGQGESYKIFWCTCFLARL